MAENTAPAVGPSSPPSLRAMVPDLVIDGALPAIAYQVLTHYGVSAVPALTAGAIFPVANIMRKFIATRRLDLIGAIVLLFIAIGVVASLISGNVLFVLIKESFITGLVGLLFLSSFLWHRPIIFYLGRQFSARRRSRATGVVEWLMAARALSADDAHLTVVWGVGYVLEAIVRVVLRADHDARRGRHSVANHGNRHHGWPDHLDTQIRSRSAGARRPRNRAGRRHTLKT